MFNELKNAKNISELKAIFKKLAMIHHPDRGGNTRDMQNLNNEYERLFNILKHSEKTNNKQFNENEVASDFIDIINKVVAAMGNDPEITIELVGTWLWIWGIKKDSPYHKLMNELKFRFNNKKIAWSFTSDTYKHYSKYNMDMDKIRDKYGSEILKGNGSNKDKLN